MRHSARRGNARLLLALTVTVFVAALGTHAAEIGHFNGGILNIRDYFVPEPGLYGTPPVVSGQDIEGGEKCRMHAHTRSFS